MHLNKYVKNKEKMCRKTITMIKSDFCILFINIEKWLILIYEVLLNTASIKTPKYKFCINLINKFK